MSYQLESIGKVISEMVNVNWFLPTIQRPYVWKAEAIEALLDSIMRGYPIGSLMVWSVPDDKVRHWESFAFEANIREQNLSRKPLSLLPESGLVQVLDGQQRLTSLLVALTGSYAPLKKGRKVSPNYNEKPMRLYLDLLHKPKTSEVDDDSVDEILQSHYRFRFFAEKAPIQLNAFWFPVATIMDVRDEASFYMLVDAFIQRSAALASDEKALASETLRRLWECVWQKQNIAYFVDNSNNPDRVVDIFIKANDTGKKLSRQDLLVSVMSVRWEQVNIQEEIIDVINVLTEYLQPTQPVRLDFVVNLALFFNGLDLQTPVADFTPANIRRMETNWMELKHALEYTCQWLSQRGFVGEALGSMNMVMLLTWYFQHSGVAAGSHILEKQVDESLRQWLIKAQFLKFWQNQSKNILMAIRSVMKRHLAVSADFPLDAIDHELLTMGRLVAMDDGWVKRLCDTPTSSKNAGHLLSLVYRKTLFAKGIYIVPLIKPTHWREKDLLEAGFSVSDHDKLHQVLGSLAMTVALDETEFEQYSLMDFEDWAATLRGDQLARHKLPRAEDLQLSNLREIAAMRCNLFSRSLTSVAQTVPAIEPELA